MNLTKLEKDFLIKVCSQSSWDGTSLDFNKNFEDCDVECDCFRDFCDVTDFSSCLQWDIKTVKGVLGSLLKKGLICIDDKEEWGMDCNILIVTKEQFYKIKQLIN